MSKCTAAVVGSRGFKDYGRLCAVLDNLDPAAIRSGGAGGADSLAARYARERGLPLVEVRPDYARHGRRAPLLRNGVILDGAAVAVAFWDGTSRGTAHTLQIASERGAPVHVYRFRGSVSE